jgi:hypothetical protein
MAFLVLINRIQARQFTIHARRRRLEWLGNGQSWGFLTGRLLSGRQGRWSTDRWGNISRWPTASRQNPRFWTTGTVPVKANVGLFRNGIWILDGPKTEERARPENRSGA